MIELSIFFGAIVVMLIVFAIVIPKTLKPADKKHIEEEQTD